LNKRSWKTKDDRNYLEKRAGLSGRIKAGELAGGAGIGVVGTDGVLKVFHGGTRGGASVVNLAFSGEGICKRKLSVPGRAGESTGRHIGPQKTQSSFRVGCCILDPAGGKLDLGSSDQQRWHQSRASVSVPGRRFYDSYRLIGKSNAIWDISFRDDV
jgi:hypothetical protein